MSPRENLILAALDWVKHDELVCVTKTTMETRAACEDGCHYTKYGRDTELCDLCEGRWASLLVLWAAQNERYKAVRRMRYWGRRINS